MTNEQINRAIAEACGWKAHYHPDCMAKKVGWTMPEKWIMHPNGTLGFHHDIPNYCTDLNAMHEAECIFDPPSEHWQYYVILDDLCGSSFKAIRATAHQRAEAFLRALGKWATTEESSVVGEEVQL